MSSIFDPQAFLQASFDEANSTESIPVPAEEYPAMAEKVDVVGWASKDGSKAGLKLAILWEIMSDEVREITGRSKNTVKQDIMLDLTDDGRLDFSKGMNVRLGKLREALGLNVKGQAFGFPMIQGQVAKVKIKHRVVEDAIFAEVQDVLKA